MAAEPIPEYTTTTLCECMSKMRLVCYSGEPLLVGKPVWTLGAQYYEVKDLKRTRRMSPPHHIASNLLESRVGWYVHASKLYTICFVPVLSTSTSVDDPLDNQIQACILDLQKNASWSEERAFLPQAVTRIVAETNAVLSVLRLHKQTGGRPLIRKPGDISRLVYGPITGATLSESAVAFLEGTWTQGRTHLRGSATS